MKSLECLILIYHHHCYVVLIMNWIRFWINCSRQHFFHFLLRKRLTWEEQEGTLIICNHLTFFFFFLFPLVHSIAVDPHHPTLCCRLLSLGPWSQHIVIWTRGSKSMLSYSWQILELFYLADSIVQATFSINHFSQNSRRTWKHHK